MRYWAGIAEKRAEYLEKEPDILHAFQSLHAENSDIVGWLRMEDARIDYPVMQTKDAPEYYLRRNFDREYAVSGTPFVDSRCEVVPVQGFNTIIYAHNTTFFWLYQRGVDRGYYAKDQYLRFDTLVETGLYQVAAAFYADATDAKILYEWDAEDAQAYTFYNYLEIDSPAGFRKYMDGITENRLFDTDVVITMDSHILTLVCCALEPYSGIPENGRFVLIAKRVEES